jgi:membrane protease YdiL (CAAX protease family)
MLGAATAVAFWVARRRGALPAMGLARGGTVRTAAVALLRYVLFLPAWMGVVLLWPLLAGRLGLDVRPQPVLQGLLELRGAALWQGILLATLVVPFFEEAIFRGFLQPVAERRLGSARGVVLTSLLFALLHGIAFGPIFAFSLLLGSLQVQGRRLTAVWLIHGLHNAGMLALAFQSSALREFLSRP